MSVGDVKQRIRERAYELWEREGRPHGRHLDHWVQAERETGSGHLGLFEQSGVREAREARRSPSGAERNFVTEATIGHARAGHGAVEIVTAGQPARATELGQGLPEKPLRSRRAPKEKQGDLASKQGSRRKN
jgi:hypothetical protein